MPARDRRDAALREHLARVLDWQDAHVGLEAALQGLPAKLRGVTPRGLPYSAWQLVEHIRIAQQDILEFSRGPYEHARTWPADYWPTRPAPPSARAWNESLRAIARDRAALRRLARSGALFEALPTGTGQTLLRELLLVADHNAYHVGQLVLLRRLLGGWPPAKHR